MSSATVFSCQKVSPAPQLDGYARRPFFNASQTVALLAVAITGLMLGPPAQAQASTQDAVYGFSGRIGIDMASMPTYEGSPNRRTLMTPDLTLSYRSRGWGTVEFGPRGLFWNAIEAGEFRFALVAQFDPGRKEKNTSRLNITPGDKRLVGMGNVKAGIEAGVGVGYGPFMLVARQAQKERGSRGMQVDLGMNVPWALSDRLDLRLALGATWANRDYMQTYFGVSAAQAQTTSFAMYTPGSGCRKVEASVSAEYAVTPNWKLLGHIGFSQLGDVAAASPIVAQRNGAFAAMGMAYEF